MKNLRSQIIKLAYEKPELREALIPILKTAASPLQEAVDAYSDANKIDGAGPRDLRWRSSQWVSLKEWTKIMKMAVPHGYNDFDVDRVSKALSKVPGISGAKFQLARESSPCVYIKGPADVLQDVAWETPRQTFADEVLLRVNGKNVWIDGKETEEDFEMADSLRLWWD